MSRRHRLPEPERKSKSRESAGLPCRGDVQKENARINATFNTDSLPRFTLAHLPTPVEELTRLSAFLGGPAILVKRDDQTGLAFGGNKTRKLEFLVGEALAVRADTLLTAGAAQSNHCRQTAAAAAHAGLRCELVLGGEPGDIPEGNLLLDTMFGATIHWRGPERRGEHLEEAARLVRASGHFPYVVPYGGSNAVGATGYALAMVELMDQLPRAGRKIDRIVLASSSGGTQAGLVVGGKATGFAGEILGVCIDKAGHGAESYEVEMQALADATAARIGLDARFTPGDFKVDRRFLGGGYGVVGPAEREALLLTARMEGILLDPVYTGRAMGALIGMIRAREIPAGETVLFWHTGGTPALFAYAAEITGINE